jgi:hypothetical protein
MREIPFDLVILKDCVKSPVKDFGTKKILKWRAIRFNLHICIVFILVIFDHVRAINTHDVSFKIPTDPSLSNLNIRSRRHLERSEDSIREMNVVFRQHTQQDSEDFLSNCSMLLLQLIFNQFIGYLLESKVKT